MIARIAVDCRKRLFFRASSIKCHLIFVDGADIIHLSDIGKCRVFQSQLLSLIEERKTAQHKAQTAQHFLGFRTAFAFGNVAADTA